MNLCRLTLIFDPALRWASLLPKSNPPPHRSAKRSASASHASRGHRISWIPVRHLRFSRLRYPSRETSLFHFRRLMLGAWFHFCCLFVLWILTARLKKFGRPHEVFCAGPMILFILHCRNRNRLAGFLQANTTGFHM